jgi:hypothetical protein
MKLQDRISARLTVDRNIINKIIVRFTVSSIMLLYNIRLQRQLKLQDVCLKLILKMHAIVIFLCCFEACNPH